MKKDEKEVGHAARLEYDELTGDLFIVFKVSAPEYKTLIRKQWLDDIEFKIVNKKLILNEE